MNGMSPEEYRRRIAAGIAANDRAAQDGRRPGGSGERPPAGKAAARRPRPEAGIGDAGRWATFNSFADLIAEHLTLAEQAVWEYLFRHARDGVAGASTRDIATRRGIDPKTVTAALAHLRKVGLVWPVHLSKLRGTASRYGIHPHPDRCLQRCIDANAGRSGRRRVGASRKQESGEGRS